MLYLDPRSSPLSTTARPRLQTGVREAPGAIWSGLRPDQQQECPLISPRQFRPVLALAAALVLIGPADATESAFTYKTTYRNVTKDPDNIWSGAALAPTSEGTVTIHEYQLRTAHGEWLISQIWNQDCSPATCPTRLVAIGADRRRTVLVDDMMHQVVPPDDPSLSETLKSKQQREFAQRPFVLSADGKTLINGDFRFDIAGATP